MSSQPPDQGNLGDVDEFVNSVYSVSDEELDRLFEASIVSAPGPEDRSVVIWSKDVGEMTVNVSLYSLPAIGDPRGKEFLIGYRVMGRVSSNLTGKDLSCASMPKPEFVSALREEDDIKASDEVVRAVTL